jgi:hypothetical protein
VKTAIRAFKFLLRWLGYLGVFLAGGASGAFAGGILMACTETLLLKYHEYHDTKSHLESRCGLAIAVVLFVLGIYIAASKDRHSGIFYCGAAVGMTIAGFYIIMLNGMPSS